MAATVETVAVIGASGNLGPSIVNALLSNPQFTVSAIARETSKATFPDPVQVIRTDFTPESLTSALKGQDAVVVAAGGEALADQVKFIDAAIAAGVKRFVPSEFGSDTTNPRALEIVPFYHGKVQVVEYLRSKENDTFSWTSVINGPFIDWGLQVGFLSFDLKQQSVKLWDRGTTLFSTSTLSLVGEAVAKVLSTEHFEATRNEEVIIQSYAVSQNQILAEFEKVSGETWKIEEQDSAPIIKNCLEKWHAGDRSTSIAYPQIQAFTFANLHGNPSNHSAKIWNEKLGLTKEDFASDIRAVFEGKKP